MAGGRHSQPRQTPPRLPPGTYGLVVVGRDADKDEPRLFRLSRVRGKVSRVGKGEAYVVPPGTDLRALTRSLTPPAPTEAGTVLVRSGTALGLRRAASTVEESVTGPDDASGWDRITLTFSSAWTFVDSVLQHGQNACVESPPQARDLAVDRLRDALADEPLLLRLLGGGAKGIGRHMREEIVVAAGETVVLFSSSWELEYAQKENPGVEFKAAS